MNSPLLHPIVLCILDGVGWGRRDDTDAVATARMPVLDALMERYPHCLLAAHGTAVGLPSDADMGNSEVGHNAMGAGRVVDQGAKLVEAALASGEIFKQPLWSDITAARTVHFLGLLSDGNVHSNVAHLHALIDAAHAAGVERIRVHILTDGRDVSGRSALTWVEPLEAKLAALPDACIASGGGRMKITMDRYQADWDMVRRGWECHVHGVGRPFHTASGAIRWLYQEDPTSDDQWLPAFVIVDEHDQPVGRIQDEDAVVFFNFRGDRAIEISQAFEDESFPYFDRGVVPRVTYAGMMQYDGDLHIPRRFLVNPPVIDETVGVLFAAAGVRTFAVSETQKYGHVTYFFNGNRSGYVDERVEQYEEVSSDNVPFNQAPDMRAREIAALVVSALHSGDYDHVRLNLANGDMVGHTGDFDATVRAMETVDECLGSIVDACVHTGAILLVTADHGNADLMFELDKKGHPILENGVRKPRTSHSLNPVPFVLVDPSHTWKLTPPPHAGIASIGGTLLTLAGLPVPSDWLPPLVTPGAAR